MKKSQNLLFGLISILTLIFSLVSISYSWIARRFQPEVQADELSIQQTGALRITFTNQASANTSASINELITFENFVFKQASSSDGVSIKLINFNASGHTNPLIEQGTSAQSTILDNSTTQLEAFEEEGYLGFRFAVCLDSSYEGTRYVFMHTGSNSKDIFTLPTGVTIPTNSSDSTISYNYPDAFRISLKYTYDGTTYTRVFGNLASTTSALSDTAVGNEVTLDEDPTSATYGEITAVDSSVNLFANQTVYSRDNYNGGRLSTDTDDWVTENQDHLDETKCLFKLDNSTATTNIENIIWIEARIWIEGNDANTVLEVNSYLVNVLLKFDSMGVV